MAKKANVTRVSRNPNNKDGCIVSLSNGDTLWLQTSYVQAVLASNFIDDVRPTALIGSEVSYDMKKYKAGDLVFDKKGAVKAGETTKFSKDGERPVNIQFGDVAGHITDFDKARMNANAIANAMTQTASLFAAKPKQLAEPAAEPAEAETSAEVVAEVEGEPTV